MTEPEAWQTPHYTMTDGWAEVPLWVMHGGAIPHPRHKWTLPDGTVVQPGETIINDPNGLRLALVKEPDQ
jgi:hypothetical protein